MNARVPIFLLMDLFSAFDNSFRNGLRCKHVKIPRRTLHYFKWFRIILCMIEGFRVARHGGQWYRRQKLLGNSPLCFGCSCFVCVLASTVFANPFFDSVESKHRLCDARSQQTHLAVAPSNGWESRARTFPLCFASVVRVPCVFVASTCQSIFRLNRIKTQAERHSISTNPPLRPCRRTVTC
jgi:hypothetical protein